jgi:hypothetical protein
LIGVGVGRLFDGGKRLDDAGGRLGKHLDSGDAAKRFDAPNMRGRQLATADGPNLGRAGKDDLWGDGGPRVMMSTSGKRKLPRQTELGEVEGGGDTTW